MQQQRQEQYERTMSIPKVATAKAQTEAEKADSSEYKDDMTRQNQTTQTNLKDDSNY